jgi:hypothetical protein
MKIRWEGLVASIQEILEGRNLLGVPDTDGSIILKCIVDEQDMYV